MIKPGLVKMPDFLLFRQSLTADPEEETTSPLQDDSLQLQTDTPVPGRHAHSYSLT